MADPVIVDDFEDGALGDPYVDSPPLFVNGFYDAESAVGSQGLLIDNGDAVIQLGAGVAEGVGCYVYSTANLGIVFGWSSVAEADSAEVSVFRLGSGPVADVYEGDDLYGTVAASGWLHLWMRGSEWSIETVGGTVLAASSFAAPAPADAVYELSALRDGTGPTYIDNPYYWLPTLVQAVRKYPRDDELGHSGGRRIYPPPRINRIVGRQS